MAGLQRSQLSFRRQGSSGLVWDDKFLKKLAEENPLKTDATRDHDDSKPESGLQLRRSRSTAVSLAAAGTELRRSTSTTSAQHRGVKVSDADHEEEPPSPRVKGCGFCGVFGAPKKQKTKKAAAAEKKKAHDGGLVVEGRRSNG